jgi:hypothetical protein
LIVPADFFRALIAPVAPGGDYAMTSHSTTPDQPQSETETAVQLFDNWFDPIEAGLRDRAREFLQAPLQDAFEDAAAKVGPVEATSSSSASSKEISNELAVMRWHCAVFRSL